MDAWFIDVLINAYGKNSTVMSSWDNPKLSDALYFAIVSALLAALIFEHQSTRYCACLSRSLSRVVTIQRTPSRKREPQNIVVVFSSSKLRWRVSRKAQASFSKLLTIYLPAWRTPINLVPSKDTFHLHALKAFQRRSSPLTYRLLYLSVSHFLCIRESARFRRSPQSQQ